MDNPLIGAPHDRVDGRLKVTGAAPYAADVAVANPLYAELVTSTIGLGTITKIDDAKARAVPGVRAIYSHTNPLALKTIGYMGAQKGQEQQSWRPMETPDVRYHGEIVALVVAETLLGAREAAQALAIAYEKKQPAVALDSKGVDVVSVDEKAIKKGDFAATFAQAAAKIDSAYDTGANTHNPMELFSSTAVWDGGDLTIHVPSQWVDGFRAGVADELGIEPRHVRVVSPYIGGAFGCKGPLGPWVALGAAAARDLKRPVKLTVTRDQGFTVATYRAATSQRVRLGADQDGTIRAVSQEGRELTSRADTFLVNGSEAAVRMYHADAIETALTAVHADRQTPGFMRAPAETPYFFALESAVDELARELNVDPVQLRIKNDIDKEPVDGVPFTSRSMVQCFEQAGEKFGWKDYTPEVGSMRDGDELVGWGVALATYPSQMSPASCRIHLDESGAVRVQMASHELGTGAYTAFAQAAAQRLGVPVSSVTVELGDTRLPPGTIAGGSISTASNVSVIELACDRILKRLGAEAGKLDLKAAFEKYGQAAIEEYAEWFPPGTDRKALQTLYNGSVKIVGGPMAEYCGFAFGAQYVEVRVDRFTGEIRVPRMVGAFAAGRIINAKTATSQLLGGMIWGVGSALEELTEVDPRSGKIVNANIAEYHVPVNADIRQIDVILVPEQDDTINPAGVKGLGELGIVGMNAAIANAVYHATGKRVRKLPIRVEDVLGASEA